MNGIELDVRLYGELSRFAGSGAGRSHAQMTLVLPAGSTVQNLLERLGMKSADRGFTFINGDLSAMPGVEADLNRKLENRDRVAFFHLKSMWPFQYRHGVSTTEEMRSSGILHHGHRDHGSEAAEILEVEDRLRHRRTIDLPEIGEAGLATLKSSSVLIVGAGGLGSVTALYLASAGVGRIGIIDRERVELSNLQRQIIHSTDEVGTPKTDSARRRMGLLNPHVRVDTFAEHFSSANAHEIAGDYDILVDGTDNLSTRYLINATCVEARKAYVYGAVYRFEGQAAVFDARWGPCYQCLFPEPPSSVTEDDGPGQEAVFPLSPGVVGTIQASETLKCILGIGTSLSGRLLLVNLLTMTFQEVRIEKDPDCPVCGKL